MTRMKLLTAVAILTAACLGVQGASAQDTVHFIGAGSSAQYQGLGVAAINDLAPKTTTVTGGGSVHHWTYKSACPGSTCITVLKDPRTNSSVGPIPNEPSTVWIVWTCPAGGCSATVKAVDIWVYHQVDSVVGVRSFMSRPNGCGSPCNTSAVESLITSDVEGTNTAYAGINNISPTLLTGGVATWGAGDTSCPAGSTTCDDEFVPADVWTAISGSSGVSITAGATDVTPEDGKAATKRDNGPATNNVSLGYGTVGSQLIGAAIQSHFSATTANPIEFGLPGLPDPFNNVTVPTTITIIPVGESPIIFIANRSNANGLGSPDATTGAAYAYTDLEDGKGTIATPVANPLSDLFSGVDCSGKATAFYDQAGNPSFGASGLAANFPTTNVERESLSGTMNTTEWTEFRTSNVIANTSNPHYPHVAGAAAGPSQEYNVEASAGGINNPLNKPCQADADGTTGTRLRAVGTGELVNTGVKGTTDSVGYTFFSFGNVSKLAKSPSYGYFTIDGVDPIFASYNGAEPGQPGNGELPACSPPSCNTSSIWNNPLGSFPNLRNGTYRAWSLLRTMCDTANPHCLSTSDAFGAQALVNAVQADIANPTSAEAVADFLPFAEVQYIRSHYNIVPGAEHADPFAYYFDWPGVGTAATLTLDVPAVGTSPASGDDAEQGGDAGGCIIPVNASSTGSSGKNANDTSLKVTAVTAETSTTTTFSYTNVGGTPLKTLFGLGGGTTYLQVWGFPAANDNGVFKVNAVGAAAVTVANGGAVGTVQSISGITGPNGAAGNGASATIAPTSCYQ